MEQPFLNDQNFFKSHRLDEDTGLMFKSAGYKYVKRTGVKGNYRYWYRVPGTNRLISGTDKPSKAVIEASMPSASEKPDAKGGSSLPKAVKEKIDRIASQYPGKTAVIHKGNMLTVHFHLPSSPRGTILSMGGALTSEGSSRRALEKKASMLAARIVGEVGRHVKHKMGGKVEDSSHGSGHTAAGVATAGTAFLVSDSFVNPGQSSAAKSYDDAYRKNYDAVIKEYARDMGVSEEQARKEAHRIAQSSAKTYAEMETGAKKQR